MVRYNQRVNPTPSLVHHNTLLEVMWTGIPVIILVLIAIPSFRLLYLEADIPKPDVTIKAIGHQWYWSYEYPGFSFESRMLADADAAKAHEPRLLGVDNIIVLPVNKVIEVDTAGSDVIHSWALPEMGVKMDAVPGPHQPHLVQGAAHGHVLRPVLRALRHGALRNADRGQDRERRRLRGVARLGQEEICLRRR